MDDPALSPTMRCPTCRASQQWSDRCRRCGCDLELLQDVAATYRLARDRCLRALRDGRAAEATDQALRCHWLAPGPESHRLRALCALIRHDWLDAAALARETIERERGV